MLTAPEDLPSGVPEAIAPQPSVMPLDQLLCMRVISEPNFQELDFRSTSTSDLLDPECEFRHRRF